MGIEGGGGGGGGGGGPRDIFPSSLSTAASHRMSKSKATADIYVRLNLTLTRSVARAGLSWPGV